jgi:hypothetical protein
MNNDKPKCRTCEAPILWAETVKGRRIPLDAQPAHDGNIRLEERGQYVTPLAIIVTGRVEGVTLYKSHFATCPDAENFRSKRH